MPTNDPEITAMSAVATAISSLDKPTAERVLRWAASRFDVTVDTSKPRKQGPQRDGLSDDSYEDFAELFHAAGPSKDEDRGLVGAYWLQEVQGHESFTSQQANDELKNLGHGIGNITRAYDGLKNQKPALIRQVSKTGKAKQGRKTYKITAAGIERVKNMIGGIGEGDDE